MDDLSASDKKLLELDYTYGRMSPTRTFRALIIKMVNSSDDIDNCFYNRVMIFIRDFL